ncbi:MAG: inositol monophosphatase [Deltaproteobacteria bacterium]|nr:inositol monophosphatase [Deltaproteobacteria bacterium]
MWQKELNAAKEAAKTAGIILSRLFGQVSHITKKGDIDLVTEADFQAEQTILEILRLKFPQDNILAEEAGGQEHTSKRTWLIDPLDGTTNFVHGFPFFAVSIALEVEKELVLGVVHNPFMNELFEAAKGTGAFLNKEPLKVSKTQNLKEALLATGFPYDIHERPERVMALLEKMVVMAQGVRRPGSAAIDMCYVAAGRLDGFWEQDLKPWDTAAGAVIVKEAGGRLSTFQGESYTPYLNTVVAANPFIHAAMIEILKDK